MSHATAPPNIGLNQGHQVTDVAHVGGSATVGDMPHVLRANKAVGVLLEHLGQVVVLT